MTQESPKTDYLKGLFSQLPQTKLPGTFRSDLMRKIQFEAARQHRREEHLSLIAIILASLVMIAVATCSLIYLEIPAVRLPAVVHDGSFPFYIYRNTRSSFAARRPSDQEGTPRQKGQVAVNHYPIIIFYRRKCVFIRKKELPLPRF